MRPFPALTLVPVAGFVLLSSCAPLAWHKADVTEEVRDRDATECAAYARSEALHRIPMPGLLLPHVIVDHQGRTTPMYSFGHDEERFLLEHDLLRACMRQRGYVLQSPSTPAP